MAANAVARLALDGIPVVGPNQVAWSYFDEFRDVSNRHVGPPAAESNGGPPAHLLLHIGGRDDHEGSVGLGGHGGEGKRSINRTAVDFEDALELRHRLADGEGDRNRNAPEAVFDPPSTVGLDGDDVGSGLQALAN